MPLETLKHFRFSGILALHAQTTRFSYVVPAGRVAYIRYCYVRVLENAAITALSASSVLFIGATPFLSVYSRNTALADNVLLSSSNIPLIGGDTVVLTTTNAVAVNATFEGVLIVGELN